MGDDDSDDVKRVLDFYVDLIENHNSSITFHLAENVVLDWFGKTIKNNKTVTMHLREEIQKATHHINNVSASENIAFKKTHHIEVSKGGDSANSESSPPEKSSSIVVNKIGPSTSVMEMGQGDGPQDYNRLMSPPKRLKLTPPNEGSALDERSPVKYLTGVGSLEFRKPSIKKFQNERRWKRPIKLHLAYTASSFKDCTIYLIIYEGNVKCRRNLFKEFCESEETV